MNWPISWNDVKNHIDDMQDGIPPELLPKGGFGYSEPSKTLTWDGDFDDTENIMGTIDACKITDKYMDLNSVESLVVKYENGNTKTLTASECIVYTDMGVQVLMPVEEEFPYVSSSPADVEGLMNKGLYFAWTPEFHVEKITFAGTIHPIDPKYLPTSLGNVLQVLITENDGNVYASSISFDEAVESILGGKYLDINYAAILHDGTGGFGGRVDYYTYSPSSYDKPTITMERYSASPLYWTPDGISGVQPSGGK